MVLLILAGITIVYVFGDNGVFGQASEAKLKTDIANWQERLEMAKSPVFIEGLGTFDADKYFDYIQQQGIINNKNTDVINNEDDTYDVTTKPGYVFLVTLMPNAEKPTDVKIEYLGQVGKIAPIIKRLDVSATSTSITGKAIVARLGTKGTIKYYYKFTSADDSTYTEITNVTLDTGATQSTGIIAGESYIIKVIAKNDVGEVELTKEITATKISVESISVKKTEVVALNKTVTLTATVKPDNATNKNVKWKSGNESIVTVSDTGTITGKKEGKATITATATDGSEKSDTCEITVKSISLNKTNTTIEKGKTETLVATVLPTDASNKDVIWSSSNSSIVSVNNNGAITGVNRGPATIIASTADDSNFIAECEVTVKEQVDLYVWSKYLVVQRDAFTIGKKETTDYKWSGSATWSKLDSSNSVVDLENKMIHAKGDTFKFATGRGTSQINPSVNYNPEAPFIAYYSDIGYWYFPGPVGRSNMSSSGWIVLSGDRYELKRTTFPDIGDFVEQKTSYNGNTFPNNGVSDDSFWYVLERVDKVLV